MDYAKMAYIKAQELEARLNAKNVRQSTRLFRARPYQRLDGERQLVRYSGGAFAVIITVRIRSEGGKAFLNAGGLRAAENEFPAGVAERTFYAAASGSGVISLESGTLQNAVLEKYEALFVGGEVTVDEAVSGYALAGAGETYAFMTNDDCDVNVVKCDSRFTASASLQAGRGEYADVCETKNGFYIAYGDVYGVLWGVAVDADLRVVARNCLGGNVGRISVAYWDSRVYVTFAQDGKAKYFATDVPRGVRGEVCTVDFNGAVQSVRAVKGSLLPALLAESGGKVFLLKADVEHKGKDTLRVRVTGRVQSV